MRTLEHTLELCEYRQRDHHAEKKRTMWRSYIFFATTAVLISLSSVFHAGEPGIWDAARDPRRALDLAALRAAEKAFFDQDSRETPGSRNRALAAIDVLMSIDAASSPEPRVRFFYGRMLTRIGEDERAVQTLQRAIDFAPNHPGVDDALFSLAVSFARLGQGNNEELAYKNWLERQWSAADRSIGLSNLAEGFMAAARMEEAVATFRESIANNYDNALAHWGLAVALDRSGDPHGALLEASAALVNDPLASELDNPNVFFVPDFDQHWYRALACMAQATALGTDHNESRSWPFWQCALKQWHKYIDAAPADNRWMPIALLRLEHCEQRAQKASGERRLVPTRRR